MIETPTDISAAMYAKLLELVLERANSSPTGCLLWIGSTVDGYGTLHFEGKTYKAHRIVALLMVKGWFPGAIVRHTCNTKLCVNDEHLIWGTRRENSNDVIEAGGNRKSRNRGVKNGNASLDEATVLLIKQKLAKGIPQQVIADEFRVSQTAICHINTGKRWSHT